MTRTSELGIVGDIYAPKGSEEWALGVASHLQTAVKDAKSKAQMVAIWLSVAEKYNASKVLGYSSFSEFCKKGLRTNEDIVQALLKVTTPRELG